MIKENPRKQEKTLSIYFSILPFLIISNIIIGLLNGVTSNFNKALTIPAQKLGFTQGVQDSGEITIAYQVGSVLVQGLVLLLTAALLIAIYRRVRYGIKPKFNHLFIFYNEHFLRNYFYAIVYAILQQIGYALLLIPGIIFSLGMFLWPFVLMEHQEKIRNGESKNPLDVIKESYRRTSGYKGIIFLKQLKWLFVVLGILLLLMIVIFMSVGGIDVNGPNNNLFGAILAASFLLILLILLFAIFVAPMYYCSYIDLMKELPKDLLEPPVLQKESVEEIDEPRREAYRESPFDTTRYPASHRSWGETGEFYDELHGYDTRDSHPGRGNTTELPKFNNTDEE